MTKKFEKHCSTTLQILSRNVIETMKRATPTAVNRLKYSSQEGP